MADLTITTSIEAVRGCGYRKPGKDGVGIYLMGTNRWSICERLPFPLHACPTCGGGVRQSRGWTWVQPDALFAAYLQPSCDGGLREPGRHSHKLCWLCSPPKERAGLLWVGEQFYPTPQAFMAEAQAMGISRKVAALPRGFVPGETVVYLAHPHVVDGGEGRELRPAVFTVFQPQRVDLVVDTDDPEQLSPKALHLAERLGDKARLVRVIPGDVPAPLNL